MQDEYEGKLFKDAGAQGDLLNVRLAIVEGFLLYSREKPLPAAKEPLTPEQQVTLQSQQPQRPSALAGSPKASHEAISALLDVRLYLHITPELSFYRRFTRMPYMDPPHGSRERGQMWKTIGYFFDVARANFYGYDMLPVAMVTQLLQGHTVVENAVLNILHKMKVAEQTARQQHLYRCSEDEKHREEDEAAMESLMGDMHLWSLGKEAK